jgi:hypothetical protein
MDTSLAQALGEIQRTLGNIEGTLNSHVKAFDAHVEMDMKAYQAIGTLKTDIAKQKGYATAIGAVAGGMIAALGYIADKVFGWGHH